MRTYRYIIGQTAFYHTISAQAPTESWEKLKADLITSCIEVWKAVKDSLCLDSPEGHDFNDSGESEWTVGTKDALSFCWRALKESRYAVAICQPALPQVLTDASLLLHALLHVASNAQDHAPRLDSGDYKRIGWLSFTQLAELRHRGAFSTVSQTFALCCAKCLRAGESESKKLPEYWYKVRQAFGPCMS